MTLEESILAFIAEWEQKARLRGYGPEFLMLLALLKKRVKEQVTTP